MAVASRIASRHCRWPWLARLAALVALLGAAHAYAATISNEPPASAAAPDLHQPTGGGEPIPSTERKALLDLYASTQGANWYINSGQYKWGDVSGTECLWYGVVCEIGPDHVALTVTELNLINNNLSGPLPADLFASLPHLRKVELSANHITSSIPSLAALSGLQTFRIQSNQLSGPIPSLAGLSSLQTFNAENNQLSGPIPSLAGLTNLGYFDVGANQLTGSIPSLTGLKALTVFYAYRNRLTGPIPSLSGLTGLAEFLVEHNSLTGPIPPLSGLTNLHVFDAHDNQLSGAVPQLSGLTNLQTFLVSYNKLTGTIPFLTDLVNLTEFNVGNNALTGSIPPLAGLGKLETFNIDNDQLTGPIPALAGLASLKKFSASSNQLSGSIPSLSGLAQLQVFFVGSNQLSSAIPSLNGLTELAFFHANANQLSGAIPTLTGLTKLQSLYLNANQLSGSIPLLTGLTSLVYFNVEANQLVGLVPSLDGLTHLQFFYVGYNQLTGGAPGAATSLVAGHSALCPNQLNPTPDPAWDAATGAAPWYTSCGLAPTTINLDQHGLTGTWYNPNASGQGFVLNLYPDNIAPGHGTVAAGWYTFSDGGGEQRWYTIQGDVYSNNPLASVGIYTASDGNLNAGPSPHRAQVGRGTLSFSDCSTGTLSYMFDDGRAGSIPLTRLTSNTTCGASGDNGALAANYLLAGAWYDPNVSGQGFFIDISPGNTTLFGSWFTYFPADFAASTPRQQWMVFQASFAPNATSATNIPIGQAIGGNFAVGGGVTRGTIGTASISFQNCTAATFTYVISPTALHAQSANGTMQLVRLGPAPPGCNF